MRVFPYNKLKPVHWKYSISQWWELHRGRTIRIAYPTALAIPFIVVIVACSGLTRPFPAFHSGDEMSVHYPIILRLAREFPRVDFTYYNFAGPPLFHLTLMLGGKIVGYDVYRLRLINSLISYLAVLLLYRLFLNQIRYRPSKALVYATVFALSPYFFGASFRLLTDNLATVFMILAMSYYYDFREHVSARPFIIACLFVAAAALTRQSYLWLGIAGLTYALMHPGLDRNAKVIASLATTIAFTPVVVFFVIWHGLWPPAVPRAEIAGTVLNFRAVVFGVAVIGVYAAFLRMEELKMFASRHSILTGGIVLLTSLLLLVFPLAHRYGDDGYVWRICSYLPTLGASSILMFVLVPIGAVSVVQQWQRDWYRLMPLISLITFLVSTMALLDVFQKYFDPIALLFVLLFGEREQHDVLATRIGIFLLIIGSVLYPIVRHHMHG